MFREAGFKLKSLNRSMFRVHEPLLLSYDVLIMHYEFSTMIFMPWKKNT